VILSEFADLRQPQVATKFDQLFPTCGSRKSSNMPTCDGTVQVSILTNLRLPQVGKK